MPSAASPIPDFFDDGKNIAAQTNGQSEPEPEPDFGFAAPAPVPSSKKSKKKGKRNANKGQAQARAGEGEDGPYGAVGGVTPSPPEGTGTKEDGVKLGGEFGKEEPLVEIEDGGRREEAVFEDTEPEPEPEPAHIAPPPAPVPSVPVRSPRPVHATAAQAARTPPNRPASLYSPPQQYGALNNYRQNASHATAPPLSRRESTTHTSPRPRFVEPAAPPHKAQPHFYGLPDFGLNFGQQKMEQAASSGKPAGSEGYCCTFDSLADSGDAASAKKAKDALLVGSEGGLEVFRVLPNKFEVVGRLEGLRGSVIGARILPHVLREDSERMRRLRPLVAVIVHGPMAEEGKDSEDEPPGFYQTSVEVYSLQEQVHVSTLYLSPPVAVEKPTLGHLAAVPGPVGDLRIAAEGKFVVVTSGKSGEVFVFSSAATAEDVEESFRCLGKFWTSLQTAPTTTISRPQSSSEGGPGGEEKDERPGVPIFSLSQRWLAVLPPSTSAHVSIGGSATQLDTTPPPPGTGTHAAPPQPPISCDIVGVDAEGTWGRLTRQAAQGLVKYSHIGFEMGRQGWRELTNPAPPTGQHTRGASREHDAGFPPTMAPVDDPSKVVKEPAIVSIVNLDSLLEAEETKPKYAPPPLSTFALQDGCNFLSLSSSGLRLLSVSRSGKIWQVWDLAQCCHGTARLGLPTRDIDGEEIAQGPCVKQLHHVTRNSEAVVTAAAWSRDDDMVAILTSQGTVHLHEVPARPSRKRKRRSTSTTTPAPIPSPPATEKSQPTVSLSQSTSPPSSHSTAGGGWMGSLKSGFATVSTGVNTVRSQTSALPTLRPSFAGFREITANAGQAGGRAIAKGVHAGYSAAKGGVGDYWHSEDNKIRHPELRDTGGGGAGGGQQQLHWIKRQSGSLCAVVCRGQVHLHPVSLYTRRRNEEVVSGLRHDRYGQKHFALPLIRTAAEAAGAAGQKRDVCKEEGVHGFWSLGASPAADGRRDPTSLGAAAAAAQKGVGMLGQQAHDPETTPPYCPFHVDPRVSIYAFDDGDGDDGITEEAAALFQLQGQGAEDEEPWLFGGALPTGRKVNIRDDDEDAGLGMRGGGGGGGGGEDVGVGVGVGMEDSEEEEGLEGLMESKLIFKGSEEVRVHTRPKRGGGRAGGLDDFEGIDEGM